MGIKAVSGHISKPAKYPNQGYSAGLLIFWKLTALSPTVSAPLLLGRNVQQSADPCHVRQISNHSKLGNNHLFALHSGIKAPLAPLLLFQIHFPQLCLLLFSNVKPISDKTGYRTIVLPHLINGGFQVRKVNTTINFGKLNF